MTLAELNQKQKDLLNEYQSNLNSLIKKYCLLNNPYKVGDVFTDHIGSVLIEDIRFHFGALPCCIYFGAKLKKDGTPKVNGSKRSAYQSNDIKNS
jgi:hypothetical protein